MTDHARVHLSQRADSDQARGGSASAYPPHVAAADARGGQSNAQPQSSSSGSDLDMFSDAADDLSPIPPSSSTFQQYASAPSGASGLYNHSQSYSPARVQTQAQTSMMSSLRGKRAPAPRALDLSPPSARVRQESFGMAGAAQPRQGAEQGLVQAQGHAQDQQGARAGVEGLSRQYAGLGLGVPGTEYGSGEQRTASDSRVERRASRPLPHPPNKRESSLSHTPFQQTYRQDSFDSSSTYTPVGGGASASGAAGAQALEAGTGSESRSAAVPLSAVGLGQIPPGARGSVYAGQAHGHGRLHGRASGLGAQGQWQVVQGQGQGQRGSVATASGSERPSLDSYYFTSDPSDPDYSDDDPTVSRSHPHPSQNQYSDSSEVTLSPAFTPVTPNMPDPFTLDRAGLIGTGELATPRWASSTLHPNLRTPAVPNIPMIGSSPSAPGTAMPGMGMGAGSNTSNARSVDDRGWKAGNDGVGLGVGVGQTPISTSAQAAFSHNPILHTSTSASNFASSPSAAAKAQARRERALSHVDSPPKKPSKSEHRGSAGPSTFKMRDASLPRLTHAGSFQDFSFDSGMEAKIGAAFDTPSGSTLGLGVGIGGTDGRGNGNRHNASAPPPISLSSSTSNISQAYQYQDTPAPYSPNSARARTAARKAERERRISGLQEAAQVVPERSTSKLTPPHSASSIDYTYAARQRDSRKTPPPPNTHAHMREYSAPAASGGGKGKHSPSAAHHHDILRHFAPKDFSHLPPSPSSASINQFLRNSHSTGNFGSASGAGGAGLGAGHVGSPAGKTPPTTSTSHVSYFPSTLTSTATPSISTIHAVNANANAPPTPNNAYKSGIGLVRSDSQRSNRLKVSGKSGSGWEVRDGRDMDKETQEAMRKLDGLGSTPKGKSGSRGSKLPPPPFGTVSGSGNGSRSGSPTRERKMSSNSATGVGKSGNVPTTPSAGDKQIISSPLGKWDVSDDSALLGAGTQEYGLLTGPTMPAARRESPSTASFDGTPTTSRDSTSITTPSSSSARPDLKQRRASAGSDFSGSDSGPHNTSGSYEKVGEVSVPPVPPLPKGYASMRYGLSHAAGSMPPPSAPIQPAYQPLVDHSYAQAPPASASVVTSSPNVHTSPASTSSPASASTGEQRPRAMNKKWSFSSAISLRLHKDTSANANASTSMNSPPQMSPDPSRSATGEHDESVYGWNQSFASTNYEHGATNGLTSAHGGSDSSSITASRIENRSATSITPVGLAPPASAGLASSGTAIKPPPTNKRLTPSGIPFFRRTSSSSTQPKVTPPSSESGGKASLPPVSKIPTSASSNTRKSMLGMHFPSMLRSSGSKRHLSQQAPVASTQEQQDYVNIGADHKAATSGWGRSRGKTMSISGPLEPKALLPNVQPQHSATLRPKASDSSLRSGHSYVHESGSQTLRASRSGLPPISGSPAVKPKASVGSLRTTDQAPHAPTPTRIPRLGSRDPSPAVGGSLMGPPAAPVAHTVSHSRSGHLNAKTIASTSSMTDFSRSNAHAHANANASISEFGSIGIPKAHVRTSSSTINDPQRSRLLAPMSARNEPKPRLYAKAPEPVVASARPSNIPPSRRTMPLPPSAAAMTISAQAKRVSRDVKPGLSRHSSKGGESGRTSRDDAPSPIKPSKSLHAKLNVPPAVATTTAAAGSNTRIPSSSSVGATSVGYRKVSLANSQSETPSPAEDEETLADAEMAAYVARRKARVAAGTGRKDDLKDIEGFPEDIEAAQPISQRTYISQNLARMSDYERKEALDYDEIYFVPREPIIREAQKGGVKYNYGYDDERGDYLVVDGDHICYRYEVMGILGKGSFGQVLECRDHKTGKSVAVKIIRNKKRFHAQAMVETKILGQLVEWDPEDKHYMVCMTDHFNFRSHLCIVTELLSINLYELIKANQFAGFSTTLIRRFTMQMLSSLQLMRSHRIVHCDLKPENILLRHPCKSGIKVIDFGSSCHETEKVYTYIQSRFYRSPEVILGMNYAMAIDMWSLGCILAELYTGVPIFPGENEHEQLACIMEVLGVPDPSIINKAQRKKLFFDTSGTPRPFVNAKGKRRRPGSRTLAQVLKCKDELFIDFISKCLTWDPDRRLKPQPAMRHPWILAGRRRYAPPPPASGHRISERSSIGGSSGSGPTPLAHSRVVSSGSGLKFGSTSGSTSTATAIPSATAMNGDGKKAYVISPPAPLAAKNGYGYSHAHAPSSASKIGYGAAPRALNTRSSFVGTVS